MILDKIRQTVSQLVRLFFLSSFKGDGSPNLTRLLDPLNIGSQVGEPSFGLLAKEVVWWKDVEDEDKEAEGTAVDQAGSVAHDVRFASQVVCNGL